MAVSESTESQISSVLVAILTLIIAFVGAYLSNAFAFLKKKLPNESSEKTADSNKSIVDLSNGDATKKDGQQTKKKGQEKGKGVAKNQKFTHPWLVTSLKSHTGTITGISFSPNGKYLATCGDDRSAYVWVMKECLHNNPKSVRVNIEFDHASKICFSPDNKAFLVSLQQACVIRVYKMSKKEDGSLGKITGAFDFPQKHQEEVRVLQIAANGSFIAACLKNSTKLWDIKGNLLASIDTPELQHACLSPCSKLLAVSDFTSQVRVWEVKFDKEKQFVGVAKAYFLDAHRASVLALAYSGDSKRMATLSKDRTWKLWDVEIDYKRGQAARLIRSWDCEPIITNDTLSSTHIAFSTNGLSVSIAKGDRLYMYNVNRDEPEVISDLMIGQVTGVLYTPDDDFVLVAGQRSIHVLHSVQGLKALLDDLKEKQKHPKSKLMQERISQMIQDTETKIQSFCK